MKSQALEKRLGYQFKDKEKLVLACTHSSYARINNERLEFLGDVVLSFVLSDTLYHSESHYSEGELTRRRSSLVNRDTLASIARDIGLGHALLLGGSEGKVGKNRDSILEDAMEAVIAAIYLDGGREAAASVIRRLWAPYFDKDWGTDEKDPKTALQEWLQARRYSLPQYKITIKGPGHAQVFKATCEVKQVNETFVGIGKNKREAEQRAAQKMKEWLEKQHG